MNKKLRFEFLFALLVSGLVMFCSVANASTDSEINGGNLVPAKRIIALAPHSVELLYSIGAGDRIVATTEYADFPEAANSIPRIGGYHGLQIEKILSYQPDLVIAWESGNKAEDLQQIESLGLNVYRSHIATIEEIDSEIIKLGELLGMQPQAEKVASDYRVRLNDLKSANKEKTPVSFFYQLWNKPLKTVTAGSWINPILEYCGGKNIFSDQKGSAYPQVSMENVLLNSPEVIIIPSHHGADQGKGKHWEAWPEIPAVANNHIFYINGDILHRSSTRVLEGMVEVCRTFDRVRSSQPKP